MSVEIAGNSKSYGYQDEKAQAIPAPSGGMAQPAPPQPATRQLNSNQPFDTKGVAGAAITRIGHFIGGVASGGGLPGGSIMKSMIPGGAAEGGAAEGIGAVAEEAAPLLLAGA